MEPRNRPAGTRRSVGLAVVIGLLSFVTGDRSSPGFVLAILLVPVVFLALSSIDGPLEQRTARIGAIVVTALLLGAALCGHKRDGSVTTS